MKKSQFAATVERFFASAPADQTTEAKLQEFFRTTPGKQLTDCLMESILQTMVQNGEISPKQQTELQLKTEFVRNLRSILESRRPIKLITDYCDSLLVEARRYAREEKFEFAVIFYTMWLEHWVNRFLIMYSSACSLAESEIERLIRTSNLWVKYATWPKFLGLPPIPKRHLDAIHGLAVQRNRLVHYKFDGTENVEGKLENSIAAAEKVVKYLLLYLVRRGRSLPPRHLRRLVRRNDNVT
jgi:hypothetical protein